MFIYLSVYPQSSIPGVPGEDYPIYAEVPETSFSCDGQVDGGNKNISLYIYLCISIYTHTLTHTHTYIHSIANSLSICSQNF